MKAAIFDLDGTLVESLPGITEALNLLLDELNQASLPQSVVRTLIGDGLWMLIRRALPVNKYPDAQIDKLQQVFEQHYQLTWLTGTIAFDGITDLLHDLSQSGCTLGVLSNKPHRYTVEITEHIFGRTLIPHIEGQQQHVAKKPDPAALLQLCNTMQTKPSETVFIGDSTIDLETGINAAAKVIGVTWGYHNREKLEPYQQPLANTVDELRALLTKHPL